ncbi:hypothetical protein CHH75_18030 [Paenibacillus sp. 7541]|uniref:Uncharacterized protein n=2 Tax=Paenibacillus TaxID=44249 RepID=A0A268EPJ0_9BACL|nr:hypothetical protein [Paenibacillus campinasensis]PAD75044.1 hypothetical protein CHH67_16450 [Paenibacillus campinasensis]PAK50546.1 hypothetical protein CHH75_18030 [Paenibacillus sp. 7541]
MFTGWKLSVLGIIIVGAAGITTSAVGLIEPWKAAALFILFVLFIGALELLDRISRSRSKKDKA